MWRKIWLVWNGYTGTFHAFASAGVWLFPTVCHYLMPCGSFWNYLFSLKLPTLCFKLYGFNLWIVYMQILSNCITSQLIDHIKVYFPQTLPIELKTQKAWNKKRYIFDSRHKIRSFVSKRQENTTLNTCATSLSFSWAGLFKHGRRCHFTSSQSKLVHWLLVLVPKSSPLSLSGTVLKQLPICNSRCQLTRERKLPLGLQVPSSLS